MVLPKSGETEVEHLSNQQRIHHATHRHPLILHPSDLESHRVDRCHVCEAPIHGGPVYGCSPCQYYLHRKCAELPELIRHPFHPRHTLTLLDEGHNPYNLGYYDCDACARSCRGFAFSCDICGFLMDVECAQVIPTVKSNSHDHLLALFKETADRFRCSACSTDCHGPIFRCVDCDFNLHLHCGPILLPHIIKHKCHIDPLTLTDSVVDDRDDEFYCDACEKERNPEHPVYYCAECNFSAHINCVLSEVLPSIEEQCLSLACQTGGLKLNTSMTREAASKDGTEQELESYEGEKAVETKFASSLETVFGFTAQDLMMASRVLEATANENPGAELAADPSLAELDRGIEMLQVEIQALTAKLKTLMQKRLQHVHNVVLEE